MTFTVNLKSKQQRLADLVRTVLANTDLSDVAPGSSLATLLEGVASGDQEIAVSALKILENSDIDSLTGNRLDQKAKSIRLPNTVGGTGRIPAAQASGPVTIGSGFDKISSKLYAGKPAPFAGATRLFLEDASNFPSTGQLYLGRNTVDRFEGPVSYTSVVDNGSFWTVELANPLTKDHLHSDLVVLSQGGIRTVPAGTQAIIPATDSQPTITFTINSTVTIPDGEAEARAQVTAVKFGEVGNALAGSITAFSSPPFPGATITNPTSFVNGRSTESDEALRQRIKNHPATLSKGTRSALVAALQGLSDPDSGRTITSVSVIEPTEVGDFSTIFIDDGTGLEPSFNVQPYELLLRSSSGQERKFRTSQSPITPAVAEGAERGPFALREGLSLTVVVDGVSETYTLTPDNYASLKSATGFEIVRDFNEQANTVGFRTLDGGKRIAIIDLSGNSEEMRVEEGDLQEILGLPVVSLRPIFLYKNNELQSFRGRTATLSTNEFPWDLTESDLEKVRVKVDGVTQEITIKDDDFNDFNTTIATATLQQWAQVLRTKVAGVKFTPSGSVLVWSTHQDLSPDGSIEILEARADGSAAGWVGTSKMWTSRSAGGVLSDVGAREDFNFNRFTGEIELLEKPAVDSKIEVGSRNTRAEIVSSEASTGLYTLTQLTSTTGTSKMVVGFDGEFVIRDVFVSTGAEVTPTKPDPSGASNVIRLTANDNGLFRNVEVGDYLYLVEDSSAVSWGSNIEGVYQLKAVGINGFATDQVYSALTANTTSGSDEIEVTHPDHGFQTGARISVSASSGFGGLTTSEISQSLVTITVINSDTYKYTAGGTASSTAQGTLDSVTYDSDTWVEFEVSQPQEADWDLLLGSPQSITDEMVNVFKSTVIPQVIDFGTVGSVNVDDTVTIINDQIASGEAVKIDPQQLLIRSNDYKEGTAAVLATIGNAKNLFGVGTASAIQSHTAHSPSSYAKSGFLVIQQVNTPGSSSSGKSYQHSLGVDRNFTDILDESDNPAIESPSGVSVYPEGFEHMWVTGRQSGLTARVYNNQTATPYSGVMRGEDVIRPLGTSDTEQTDPDTYDRYSNYGLRFADLTLNENDRLVVEMDLDPADKTVAIPMSKQAVIQDIEAITGSGKGQVISFRLQDPDNNDLPFFDSQSVYRDFDFRDFKLLTKSVGLYRDFDTLDAQSTGRLTAQPSGASTGIVDGDTFTLDDGVNPAVTFEFDSGGGVSGSNTPVTFVDGEVATGTLTAQPSDSSTGIVDGDTFTLDDGVNPAVTFEFDDDGSTASGNIAVPFTSAEAATGSLTAQPADPSTGIADGDTFTIDDGVNPAVTFEFDDDSSVAVGNVAVVMPSSTASASQIKTAMINAINGASSFDVTASSGSGNIVDLVNDTPGTQGNIPITESMQNSVSLFPTGMSGGVDDDTASDIQTAMINTINNTSSIDITASTGTGDDVDLVNDTVGTQGNVAITESLTNTSLSPTGMSGGVDNATASTIQSAILSAINGVSGLDITAYEGSGDHIHLINDTVGAQGNVPITESLANTSLNPQGMDGGSSSSTNDRALVYRSVPLGSPNLLRLSLRYATEPDVANPIVTHLNSFDSVGRLTVVLTMPSGALVSGSTYNTGTYDVTVIPDGNLYRFIFSAAGLNTGGEYQKDDLINVGGNSSIAGTYHIVSATTGEVQALAPGDGGLSGTTQFNAVQNPLRSFPLAGLTWDDLASAITDYYPDNPVATGDAIGTDTGSENVGYATYMTHTASTAYTGDDMPGAFDHHTFDCHLSGSAGIYEYDSSTPSVNGIKATVQSVDAIFPTQSEASGTSYSPVGEEVAIVPTNSRSLASWMEFNAASSLNILAHTDRIESSTKVQISSKQDGSLGAVRVTGVSANKVETPVFGNSTIENNSVKMRLLSAEAKTLVRGGLVRLDNTSNTEILRPYRDRPEGASVTAYNTADIGAFFRETNSVKYVRRSTNTARIVFYRFGTGPGQSEPLSGGDEIVLTDQGGGVVQVTSNGGDLAARTGDMMYVKPSSTFPSDVQCQTLPSTGITDTDSPEYLGYPVTHVIDEKNVLIVAPNITSFGSTNIGSSTDLVFVPAIYNEKNIRTNKKEGAKFDTEINNGEMYVLVKPLGGNMVSVWVQNSSSEATDDMLLDELLVNTDDWVTFGDEFDLANQGTYKLVAHNGRNQIVVYNPNGGREEIVDAETLVRGGKGQRDWKIGPFDDSNKRPIRVVDSNSVRIDDRLRISSPNTTSQWFPDTMIGSFDVIGMGWIGITQATGSLTAIAADPSTGIADGDIFTLSDGEESQTFEFDTNGTITEGNKRIAIGSTDTKTEVKSKIIDAINSLKNGFGIIASDGGGDVIDLLNRKLNTNANQTITETTQNAVSLSPTGMSGASKDDGAIQPFIDVEIRNAPAAVFDQSTGVAVDKFIMSDNSDSIGFLEQDPFYGFRVVAGHAVNPQNAEESDLFLQTSNNAYKFSSTFGTKVSALYKTGFEERTFQGIDGYKVFGGLVQQAHRTLDGLPSNPILFPGEKAMGAFVEVLPPLIKSIEIDLQVTPNEGVTINSIADTIKSNVASFINRLGVGRPVVISEIIRLVQEIPGVFSVEIADTRPADLDGRIVVSDVEKPFVLSSSRDITVG